MSLRGRLAQHLDLEHPAVASLIQDGVAIVRVCAEWEADLLRDLLWDDLEALGTGIRRDDPATWKNCNWPQTTHGLLQNQSFGLRPAACEARLKCVQAFKALFKDAPVNSSFDAVGVARPECQERAYQNERRLNARFGEGPTLVSSWLHVDQSNRRPDCLRHIQGAFALTPLGEAEQRTQFIIPPEGETAQSFRDRFLAAFPPKAPPKKGADPERAEWVSFALKNQVHQTDPVVVAKRKWLIANGRVYAPQLKQGEMVLWDSGVPHASIPGECAGREPRGIRMSTFVSMLPAALVTGAERVKRDAMLEKQVTSGHRVTAESESGKLSEDKFPKTGRVYPGQRLPAFNEDEVVRAAKRHLAASEEPEWSVARKTQRLCAGAGL